MQKPPLYKRKACWISTFLVLLVIGLLLGFLWPRVPRYTLSDPYIPQGSPGIVYTGPKLSSIGGVLGGLSQPLSLTIYTAVNVTVESDNYYDITASFEFTGNLKDLNGNPIKSFQLTGNTEPLTFKARSSTFIVIQVPVVYNATSLAAAATDSGISTVLTSCVTNPTKLHALYHLVVKNSALQSVGITPQFDGTYDFNCPVNAQDVLKAVT
ncbi:hypothetical protein EDD86DRAFT_68816 [Gorgonomyces haynaldii]|nr:hypothetical protein EDD86DRAFT_68816 [Gorgonomyces haynaldii]